MTGSSPEECLDQGRVADCLRALEDRVRREPAKAPHRVFLFQVLSLTGQWERALTQLNVAAELDPKLELFRRMYAQVLAGEIARARVISGKASPLFLGEPEPWMANAAQALRLLATGNTSASDELRRAALRGAVPHPGAINGQPFKFLLDADARLGPILELFMEGSYYWVPFTRIRSLAMEPPREIHDLLWPGATITWTNGGQAGGFIPGRYPGSETDPDPQIVLARKTEWADPLPGYHVGRGQRLLWTDIGAFPLLDVRSLSIEHEAGMAELATAGATATAGEG